MDYITSQNTERQGKSCSFAHLNRLLIALLRAEKDKLLKSIAGRYVLSKKREKAGKGEAVSLLDIYLPGFSLYPPISISLSFVILNLPFFRKGMSLC